MVEIDLIQQPTSTQKIEEKTRFGPKIVLALLKNLGKIASCNM